ncbi:omega-hydroxyceramide transacylase-like isoform X2 [Ranitomeya variabilis]|uniref:omega-hydroxyceramide transacylase-like isoform X2 n=1 Tax=Ranitomeya variabilis TaxID=490064 RepID=UPI0040566325
MEQETGRSPLSLSFSGSGYLSLYQIGAVKALLHLAPDILTSAPKVYGASAGSLVAAAVVFQVNLDELQNIILDAAIEARKSIFGPFFGAFNLGTIFRRALLNFLPDNAHLVATGRLNVALTRLSDGKNILVSDFKSKDEVIQALICSCFVPFYCGFVPPTFQGVALHNFYRQGYKDAVLYLLSNGKLHLQPAYPISKKVFTKPKKSKRRQHEMIMRKLPIELCI